MKRHNFIKYLLSATCLIALFFSVILLAKRGEGKAERNKNNIAIIRSFLLASLAPKANNDNTSIGKILSRGFLTPEDAKALLGSPNLLDKCAEIYSLRPSPRKESEAFSNIRLFPDASNTTGSTKAIDFAIVIEVDGRIVVFGSAVNYTLDEFRRVFTEMAESGLLDKVTLDMHLKYLDSLGTLDPRGQASMALR